MIPSKISFPSIPRQLRRGADRLPQPVAGCWINGDGVDQTHVADAMGGVDALVQPLSKLSESVFH